MKFKGSDSSYDYKNYLPGLRLPNPESPEKKESKKEKNSTKREIKRLIKDMKNNKRRTTNFYIIFYLTEHDFDKILISEMLQKIKEEFNLEPDKFINSHTKNPFDSEKKLVQSVMGSLRRNKAFIIEQVGKEKFVLLNLPKALEYLNKMYKKYTNSDNSDIASISSRESISKFFPKNEEISSNKKLLGNKTLRKKSKKGNELKEILLNSKLEEKSHSTYKNLKDNLKPIPNNKVGKIYYTNFSLYNNENEINKNETSEKIMQEPSFEENDKIEIISGSNSLDIINNFINTSKETKKVINSYIKKLDCVKEKIEERDNKLKIYEENKTNLKKLKQDLDTMYKIYEMKLEIKNESKKIKSIKHILTEKNNKKISKLYKEVSNSQIVQIKKCMNEMQLLEKDILIFNKEIVNGIQNITLDDNEKVYFGENEIKKEYNDLCRTIEEENKINESSKGKDLLNTDTFVKNYENKLKSISSNIFEGK